jgi:uncharacterized protein involved in exopolysaccharide biosynthesis
MSQGKIKSMEKTGVHDGLVAQYDDEIDLVELVKTLWKGKLIIIGFSAVFFVVAVAISIRMPNMYRAEVLLAPAASEAQSGLSGLAGLGGLASLAGVNIGGSGAGVNKTTLTLEIMKSRAFLAKFIRRHDLDIPLVAAKSWDFDNGWNIDKDIYDVESKKWVRLVSGRMSAEPSDLALYEIFRYSHLTVSQDVKSQLIFVGIESMSPSESQKWASWLIEDINRYMRERDISEAAKSIEYLQAQLEKTSLAEMRQIFYELIEEQTKSMMLAQVRDEYALKTIDPAVESERKISPNRSLICIVAGLLGGMFGVLTVLIMSYVRRER